MLRIDSESLSALLQKYKVFGGVDKDIDALLIVFYDDEKRYEISYDVGASILIVEKFEKKFVKVDEGFL